MRENPPRERKKQSYENEKRRRYGKKNLSPSRRLCGSRMRLRKNMEGEERLKGKGGQARVTATTGREKPDPSRGKPSEKTKKLKH